MWNRKQPRCLNWNKYHSIDFGGDDCDDDDHEEKEDAHTRGVGGALIYYLIRVICQSRDSVPHLQNTALVLLYYIQSHNNNTDRALDFCVSKL